MTNLAPTLMVLAFAPGAVGASTLWWCLTRADPSKVSTYFIGSAGIILCGISSIFCVTVGVYLATV